MNPDDETERTETVGLVLAVKSRVGYLLTPASLLNPNLLVFFDSSTLLDGECIASSISESLDEVVQPGLQVDISLEKVTDMDIAPRQRAIKMTTFTSAGFTKTLSSSNDDIKEQPVSIIKIQQNGITIGSTMSSELVIIHPLIYHELDNQQSAEVLPGCSKKQNCNENFVEGNVFNARLILCPQWVRVVQNRFFSGFYHLAISLGESQENKVGMGKILRIFPHGGLIEMDTLSDLGSVYFSEHICTVKPLRDLKIGEEVIVKLCPLFPHRMDEGIKLQAFDLKLADSKHLLANMKMMNGMSQKPFSESRRKAILQERVATECELELLSRRFPELMKNLQLFAE